MNWVILKNRIITYNTGKYSGWICLNNDKVVLGAEAEIIYNEQYTTQRRHWESWRNRRNRCLAITNEWLPPSFQRSEMPSHLAWVSLFAWRVCVRIPFRGVGTHPLVLVALLDHVCIRWILLYETDRRLWHLIPDGCLLGLEFWRKTLRQRSTNLDQSCCLLGDRIKPGYSAKSRPSLSWLIGCTRNFVLAAQYILFSLKIT